MHKNLSSFIKSVSPIGEIIIYFNDTLKVNDLDVSLINSLTSKISIIPYFDPLNVRKINLSD